MRCRPALIKIWTFGFSFCGDPGDRLWRELPCCLTVSCSLFSYSKMIHRTTYTSILLKSQEEAFITVLYGITSVYGRNQFFTEFRIFTRDNGSSFCKFHWPYLCYSVGCTAYLKNKKTKKESHGQVFRHFVIWIALWNHHLCVYKSIRHSVFLLLNLCTLNRVVN